VPSPPGYHSGFDGPNNLLYDEGLDLFLWFSRANVGMNQRSFQRAVSRDLRNFSALVPIRTRYSNGSTRVESFYGGNVFTLPQYPGVLLAAPQALHARPGARKRTNHLDAVGFPLMHSYDYGSSWRRTSGWGPWIPNAISSRGAVMEGALASKLGRHDVMFVTAMPSATGTAAAGPRAHGIDVVVNVNRSRLEMWSTPLPSSTASADAPSRLTPSLTHIRPRSSSKLVFTTKRLHAFSSCELSLDYSQMEARGGSVHKAPEVEVMHMSGFAASQSRVDAAGAVTWVRAAKLGREEASAPHTDKLLPSRPRVGQQLRLVLHSGTRLHAIHCRRKASAAGAAVREKLALSMLQQGMPWLGPGESYGDSDFGGVASVPEEGSGVGANVRHAYWAGRETASVFTLDTSFVDKVERGHMVHELVPIRPQAVAPLAQLDARRETITYPTLIVHPGCGPMMPQYWLFINAMPRKKVRRIEMLNDVSDGEDQLHQLFMFLQLRLAHTLEGSPQWLVPQEFATKRWPRVPEVPDLVLYDRLARALGIHPYRERTLGRFSVQASNGKPVYYSNDAHNAWLKWLSSGAMTDVTEEDLRRALNDSAVRRAIKMTRSGNLRRHVAAANARAAHKMPAACTKETWGNRVKW
jgi:hypothetical protein